MHIFFNKTKFSKYKKNVCLKLFNNKLITLILISISALVVLSGCENINSYLNNKFFKENNSQQIHYKDEEYLQENKYSTPYLASMVKPAVVAIEAVNNNVVSIGSGVCVKSGGYVLTNAHVVSGSNKITLFLSDNSVSDALLLWKDEVMDIAILKSQKALPYLPMGDNKQSLVGEDVIAVGTPLSLNFTHSFTKGIISALNRTITIYTDNGNGLMQNLIQHDASINPGNSGGPLINSQGEVVGINTLKLGAAEGIGFAIPINAVSSIVNGVYENYNYYPPYLGVFGYDFTLKEHYMNYDEYKGFYVESVSEGSPAYKAGLKEGDVVLKINNTEIVNALDFREELFKHSATNNIKLTVKRDGEIIDINVGLGFNGGFNLYDIN